MDIHKIQMDLITDSIRNEVAVEEGLVEENLQEEAEVEAKEEGLVEE